MEMLMIRLAHLISVGSGHLCGRMGLQLLPCPASLLSWSEDLLLIHLLLELGSLLDLLIIELLKMLLLLKGLDGVDVALRVLIEQPILVQVFEVLGHLLGGLDVLRHRLRLILQELKPLKLLLHLGLLGLLLSLGLQDLCLAPSALGTDLAQVEGVALGD